MYIAPSRVIFYSTLISHLIDSKEVCGCFLMSRVRMLHFLKDWWKFIQIHQYYTMALREISLSSLASFCQSSLPPHPQMTLHLPTDTKNLAQGPLTQYVSPFTTAKSHPCYRLLPLKVHRSPKQLKFAFILVLGNFSHSFRLCTTFSSF